MAERKPATQREMLYQLWFAVIGSNGDGLASQVRDINTWIKRRPVVCPVADRRSWLTRPVTVALAAAVSVKLFDWIPAAIAAPRGAP